MKTLLGIALLSLAIKATAVSQPAAPAKRWLYLSSNLLVDENVEKNAALLRRAKEAGYNGLLFTDFKLGFWWTREDMKDRYQKNALRFRGTVRDLGLELAVAVMPFGYANSWFLNDPNLAQGVPIRDCPMIVENGELHPVPTIALENGSFENHNGDKIANISSQDGAGSLTFADTEVKHDGAVSLRMSPKEGEPQNVRIFRKLKVKPWQHYRIRCWLKADALTADGVRAIVLAGEQSLQWQFLSRDEGNGKLKRFEVAKNVTFGWTEQLVDFNSLGNSEVNLVIGMWNGKSGNLWLDELSIESTPTLNLLRRDDLPFELKTADGKLLKEGVDVEPVKDEKAGRDPSAGEFSTRHAPPVIRLAKDSALKNGDLVQLSGYHPHLVYNAQVNCSMLNPAIWKLANDEVEQATKLLDPDIIFLSHDEIRSVGWEPDEQKFENAGAVIAENMRRSQATASKASGGKPLMVWSDMFDPSHNARKNFYLARGTVEGSWEGLEPSTGIMKWGIGNADKGLDFFSETGPQDDGRRLL